MVVSKFFGSNLSYYVATMTSAMASSNVSNELYKQNNP